MDEYLKNLDDLFVDAQTNNDLKAAKSVYEKIAIYLNENVDRFHPAIVFKYGIDIAILEMDFYLCLDELERYWNNENSVQLKISKSLTIVTIAVCSWGIVDAPVIFIQRFSEKIQKNYNRLFASGLRDIFNMSCERL